MSFNFYQLQIMKIKCQQVDYSFSFNLLIQYFNISKKENVRKIFKCPSHRHQSRKRNDRRSDINLATSRIECGLYTNIHRNHSDRNIQLLFLLSMRLAHGGSIRPRSRNIKAF
jgi:hypothetical protein